MSSHTHSSSRSCSRPLTHLLGIVVLLAALLGAGCSTERDAAQRGVPSNGQDAASTRDAGEACSVAAPPRPTAPAPAGSQPGGGDSPSVPEPQHGSYSADATAPQSRSCDAMSTFLATADDGFELRSYVFYGHLRTDDGVDVAFSTLSQHQPGDRSDPSSASAPTATASSQTAAVTFAADEGVTVGGVMGVAGETAAISAELSPWSLRVQDPGPAATPSYVQARVLDGRLGQPGAVIELSAQTMGILPGGAAPEPIWVNVRAVDVAGVGQWGYGPSGFFPQWLYPEQRTKVDQDYGGSIGDYLAATGEPLTDQGSYYYSSPVLEVQRFAIFRSGQKVFEGTEGELLADYVTQSFDPRATEVIEGGVTWTEFSVLLDDRRTMKIGRVAQDSVGEMPYAALLDARGDRHANGALRVSQRWNLDDISIEPDTAASWTSPNSGETYTMRYRVRLAESETSKAADLRLAAMSDDQELNVAGRSVYEGLFRVEGTLDGEPVGGYAWAEIQPSGTL